MDDDAPNFGFWAAIAALAVVGSIGAWLAMSQLANPHDFALRLSRAASQVDRTQELAARPGRLSAHSPHAVCPGREATNLEAIRINLSAAASRAGLPSPVLSLAPLDEAENATLGPVKVSLQATGSYESVLGLLGQLERTEPEVFIDKLDLRTKANALELALSGKVYCWIAAH
jgi:hypothetical protein